MTKSKTSWEEEEKQAFVDELKSEMSGSERAAVLIAGAMVDEILKRLITTFMVPGPVTDELLTGGPNAPLGSFSARIKVAYSLGLITKAETETAEVLRGIRNMYAHRLSSEINQDKLKASVEKLIAAAERMPGIHAPEEPTTNKNKIVGSATALLLFLQHRFDEIAPARRTERQNVNP